MVSDKTESTTRDACPAYCCLLGHLALTAPCRWQWHPLSQMVRLNLRGVKRHDPKTLKSLDLGSTDSTRNLFR